MQAPSSPSWTRGSASGRRTSEADPNMRVSDADRAAVADRLSKHYGDGRLDQAEFDERMDQAMKAKTQSDLSGLFADLPGEEPPEAPRGRRDRSKERRFIFLVLVVVIAAAVGEALVHAYIPWLLIGLLVFVWLRRGSRQHDPRQHDPRQHQGL